MGSVGHNFAYNKRNNFSNRSICNRVITQHTFKRYKSSIAPPLFEVSNKIIINSFFEVSNETIINALSACNDMF